MIVLPFDLFVGIAYCALMLSPVLLPLAVVVVAVRGLVRRARRTGRRFALLQITL